MTHRHKCSQGHVWEHSTVPSRGLTEQEWSAANKHAHTCGVCGEVVYTRITTAEERKRQADLAMDAGRRNAEQLINKLEEVSPDIEPAELLATVHYFAYTVLSAVNEFSKENEKNINVEKFWQNEFGDTVPNPFSAKGVQQT